MNDSQGFIYFIVSPDMEAVKIGFASDPLARLRHLNTAHHDDLELLMVVSGTRADEGRLHQRFESKHLRREWFRYDDEMILFVDDLNEAADELGAGEFNMDLTEALAVIESWKH